MFRGNAPLIVGKGTAQVKYMLPSLHIDQLVLWETRDTRLQNLVAIRGLSQRLGRVEFRYPATRTMSEPGHSEGSSPGRLLGEDVGERSPLFLTTLMVLVIQSKDRGDGLSEVEIDPKLGL
ncbi:unnamed protein product [Lota lota]